MKLAPWIITMLNHEAGKSKMEQKKYTYTVRDPRTNKTIGNTKTLTGAKKIGECTDAIKYLRNHFAPHEHAAYIGYSDKYGIIVISRKVR